MTLAATDILKKVTQPYHEVLDQLPLMRRLMSPELDTVSYIRVLKGMHAGFGRIENLLALRKANSFFEEWHYFPKGPSLLADLLYFQEKPDAWSAESHATETKVGLGSLYVLFGSCLGAAFVAKHVTKTLALDAHRGLRFYSPLGDEMARWNKFKEKLNYDFKSKDLDALKCEAIETFEVFIQNLKSL